MNINLAPFLRSTALLCLLFIYELFTTKAVVAGEAEDFINEVKKHYESTQSITAFSFSYHFLNKQYRDSDYWDYQAPNRGMSVRMVEVDLVKKHFYDNDILYSSGGLLNDRVLFQNDTHSYFYERNGNFLGKRIFNRGMGNFDRFISYNAMNIDFLAVRPLLEKANIEGAITLRHNKQLNLTVLTHKVSDDNIIDYKFSNSPLKLRSIYNKSRQALYVYDDYQTTRGITYARSVNKYYNGAKEPAYISFNDQFHIIDQVEPAKLKLPQGYDAEIAQSDGVLVSTEIAKNLYLVTDSSAWRNSLFKVNGNEIMVFGGSGYPELAQKIITLIKEQFPDKTISAVYVTHPHGSDIDGLTVYAKQGIKILADEYTISAIKAYPPFAGSIETFKFNPIKNEQIIKGAQFYVLENMHSKKQSFVHFKDSEIIFQADFINIAFDNTIAKVIPNYTRTFIDFIRAKQLNFSRIVSNYSNNDISVEVVNKTYDAMM